MKIKLLIGLPCLLLFSLSVPVIACECNPLCEGCQSCEAGVCVDDPDLCIPCQNCEGGECVDDDDLCFGCQRCSIGYCEDDNTKCTGECHDGCSGGTCVEDPSKCNDCQNCSGGDCVLKPGLECDEDSDCEPEEHCDDCECVCDNCWATEYVSRLDETCEECSGFFTGGCVGFKKIRNGYAEWRSVGSGEGGWCKNPTRQKTVGFIYECTEDWDVSKILACAIAAGPGCVAAYYVGGAPGAWVCILTVWPLCAHEGICGFIDDCVAGDELTAIERQVIDEGEDWGDFCVGG